MNNKVPGFYGKLPVLGDFVSRRLPRDFIEPWDEWLQHSITASHQELGDKWLETYLTAPIWRFALTPLLCGDSGWMGVIMPSVDRVGRYFPLTIAVPIQQQTNIPSLFNLSNQWYEELEHVALSALEHELGLEKIETLLNNISSVSVSTLLGKVATSNGNNQPFSPYHSLWYSPESEHHKARQLIFKGLPPIHEFSHLLGYRLFERNTEKNIMSQSLEYDFIQAEEELEQFNRYHVNNVIRKEELFPTRWLSYGLTHAGNYRQSNQDAFLDRPDLGLWAVADGMGGHQAGDVASRMVIHNLNELKLAKDLYSNIGQVQNCLHNVNKKLRQFATHLYSEQTIGSTVVALLANKQHLTYLWAGDSRLYLFREGELTQLSNDHSEGQNDSLLMPVKKSHIITRAVGAYEELELDSATITIQKGDRFLLCSDGLDNEVSDDEIETILKQNDYRSSVEVLIGLVLSRKARDNVTVLVIDIL